MNQGTRAAQISHPPDGDLLRACTDSHPPDGVCCMRVPGFMRRSTTQGALLQKKREPREVAALPVQEQARARPVVTQQSVRPSNLFVQAGAFANYDNAYRLSARLSRYGTTQVTETSG